MIQFVQSPDHRADMKKSVFERKPTNSKDSWQVVKKVWEGLPFFIDPISMKWNALLKKRSYSIKFELFYYT